MAGSDQGKPGPSNKRQRELARAKYERQTARRRAEAAKRSRRRALVGTLGVMSALAVVIAVAAWPESTPDEVSAPAPSESATASASPTATTKVTNIAGCKDAPTPRVDNITFEDPEIPPLKGTTATLTLATNCGPITIATDIKNAPKTVASMAFLTKKGYFSNTQCHRLTTQGIFVMQCGDPANTGQGGPGYEFPDELTTAKAAGGTYPRGTIAMANAGPNTNGSQFFIVYKDSPLPPNYTMWGKVTKGLEIVDKVAKQGVSGGGSDGRPVQPFGIIAASISKPS